MKKKLSTHKSSAPLLGQRGIRDERARAVFIDKDGTLIKNIPYNIDTSRIDFTDGTAEALRLLKQNNFLLIVISNQSGIAKGLFSIQDLELVHTAIQQKLSHHQVQLNAFYYCPHFPNGIIQQYSIECECRKPKPGLILNAANDLNVDLEKSWMIGDILDDVEAGKRTGCRTILLDNGNETEWIINTQRSPHFTVNNLKEAAEVILHAIEPETNSTKAEI